MKIIFKDFLAWLISKSKIKNQILFESIPDMSGNSYALYKEILEKEINHKYNIYWLVNHPEKFTHIKEKNVYFVKKPVTKIGVLKFLFRFGSSKLMITENEIYPKLHNKMFWIHLTHGTPIKNTKNFMYLSDNIDLVLCQSEHLKEIVSNAYNISVDKLIYTGFPRNDLLINMSNQETEEDYIVWLPTFRKHNNGNRVDSLADFPYGMPIIKNKKQLLELNEVLNENNRMLYIKPHFASDLTNWSNVDCSNIKIINDQYFLERDIQLYEFLGKSKGLITDYSSVYYDYLLLKKPIALTIDDLEEYKENLGFVFEDYYEEIKGFYIKEYIELKMYLENLVYDKEIEKKIDKFNQHTDNESAKRLIEYLRNKSII